MIFLWTSSNFRSSRQKPLRSNILCPGIVHQVKKNYMLWKSCASKVLQKCKKTLLKSTWEGLFASDMCIVPKWFKWYRLHHLPSIDRKFEAKCYIFSKILFRVPYIISLIFLGSILLPMFYWFLDFILFNFVSSRFKNFY